jgi:hypothetical protein
LNEVTAAISEDGKASLRSYSVMQPALHSLHECLSAEDFANRFRETTGHPAREVIHEVVTESAPQAVFLTGSIPLGMATHGSDIDLIVLVDNRDSLLDPRSHGFTNTDRDLTFANDSDPLRAKLFLRVVNGVMVDVTVVIASAVKQAYERLRRKGPELSEYEIMTLGRLNTGWLLWQTEGFLARGQLNRADRALDVHCSTRNFVSALSFRQKGLKALDLGDIPLALHLGRSSVEMAYLAYFASEGLSYLGAKWLAQIGFARGAADRLSRHPLLGQGAPLLFPAYGHDPAEARRYLRSVSQFLTSMRALIEEQTLFRIAFMACPMIHRI